MIQTDNDVISIISVFLIFSVLKGNVYFIIALLISLIVHITKKFSQFAKILSDKTYSIGEIINI